MHCHAYGTVVETNIPWSSLIEAQPRANGLTVQVETVELLPAAEPVACTRNLQGRTLQFSGIFPNLGLQIDDWMLVLFDKQRRRLQCLVTAAAEEALIEYWLLRQCIPMAQLVWDDAEMLHAGSVRIGDEAVAFLAPSFTGKSTLVGHLIAEGHALIADDHLMLRTGAPEFPETILTLPTIPFYRNYRTFESLGHHTTNYDPAPCRLRVIYVLKIADPAAPVSISPLSNAEAALELLYQAPYNLQKLGYPSAMPFARRRFELISNLPLKLAVRRLDVPRSLDRLPEVSEYLIADYQRIAGKTHARV